MDTLSKVCYPDAKVDRLRKTNLGPQKRSCMESEYGTSVFHSDMSVILVPAIQILPVYLNLYIYPAVVAWR